MPAGDKLTRQEAEILRLLRAKQPGEVSAWDLSRISLSYNARIFSLRRLGLRIVSRTENSGGRRRGFFRLVSTPTAPSSKDRLIPSTPARQADLFTESLKKDRTYEV